MFKMLLIGAIVIATESALLVKLFKYITIERFDLVAFVLTISGFFAVLYYLVWKGAKKCIDTEMKLYKFCVDCAIETKKPYKKEFEQTPTKLTFAKPHKGAWLFIGRAKDFKGFEEEKDANSK